MHMPAQGQNLQANDPVMPLWRLHRQGHDAACEIVVQPSGFEGRYLFDGRFLYSYTFERPDDVVAWAKEREELLRRQGWTSRV
jgi:hypothetical protein